MYAQQFRSTTAIFQTHQFLLLLSPHFLTLLDYKESSQQWGSIPSLELLPVDLNRFCTLLQNAGSIQAAKETGQKLR